MNGMTQKGAAAAAPAPPTVSHLLGEMTWLLTQFYIFRDGDRPVGLALWAKCGPDAEKKLHGGMVKPENRLALEEWISGDRIWLVDLIAPFASGENRHREIMFADLISGPLKGKAFSFHQTDPQTGERSIRKVDADAGDKLKGAIESALAIDP